MAVSTIVLVCLALLFCALAVHPFLTYPLSLAFVRAIRGKSAVKGDEAHAPRTFDIVFCAYNEQAMLPKKLENLLEIRQKWGQDRVAVLAYCDLSTDRTLEILNQHRDQMTVVEAKARTGKSVGMNELLSRATADIVIFTDANVLLSPDVIPAFTKTFSDPDVGVACGHLIYTNDDTPTADVGTSYWKLEEVIKTLETDTGSAMGADGSIFAIRRKLFRPVPSDIIDDFFTSLNILCDGYRTISCQDAHAFERSTDVSAQEYRRKVRIACRAFNCHRLMWPRLRTLSWLNLYKYLSHKLVRWLAVVWLLAAVICGILAVGTHFGPAPAAILAGVMASGVALARLLAALRLPVISKLWEVWLAFVATGQGVWCSLRGERFQTWVPATSARQPSV